MKEVTIDTVRERIAELEMVHGHGDLSLRGEFELACLRRLEASLEADAVGQVVLGDYDDCGCHPDARVVCIAADGQADWENFKDGTRLYTSPPAPQHGVDDDLRNVIALLENNEWAEHCTSKVLGSRLESEITRLVGIAQPAPVAHDAEPSMNAMMRALDAFYADDDVPERAMLAAFKILLADVRKQSAPVVPDRERVRGDHAKWSQETFGNVGPIGPLKHLAKEAMEAAAAPDDLSEWADMQFLLWDAQRRAGITDEQITQAMIEKLAVNKARQWPEPKDGEPRLHIQADNDNTAQQFEALATSAGSGKP